MNNWSRQELFRFLAEKPRIGRLATVTPTGDPHVVPVWYRIDDERILVHTMGSMQKTRNLRHHPRFALTVDTEEWPYRGVTVRGKARIALPDEIAHEPFVETTAVAYLGEGAGRPLGRYMATLDGDHTMLILEPEAWYGFDYS